MYVEWQIWNEPAGDITNIGWRFVRVNLCWPMDFHFDWRRYDGLPLRSIGLGLFSVGWGVVHEWVDTQHRVD